MSQDFIFHTKGLGKKLPNGRQVLSDFWLSFYWGVKIGLIGPNGSGKSTLLRIMGGLDTDIEGEARLDPNARVGYLPQEPELDPDLTVRENIELGLSHVRELLDQFDAVNERFTEVDPDEMDDLINEQAVLQDAIEAAQGWQIDQAVEIAMDALRVPPGDSDVAHLSGGEVRRVALCQLLLSNPDILLLDEPTNHLDAESVAWLERTLREYEGTVIVVTHDRYFLDNVTGWILELENGKGLPFEGNYSSWLHQKAEILRQQGKDKTGRAGTIARELEWISLSSEGRHEQAWSRLRAYDALLQGMGREQQSNIVIPAGPRLGDLVVELDKVSKGFGDRLLIDDLTLTIPKGSIVGIVGANGAGKTTLHRLLTGEEEPDAGTVRIGETVKLANVHQMRHEIDDERSVFDNIANGQDTMYIDGQSVNARAYAGAFGFKGSLQQQQAGTLSGGERNRLYLATVLQQDANVLLLDEPTNDLDVSTLRDLEDSLLGYPGCVLVISHDRWFLDRVATHILAFEGDSEVILFEGNYEEYDANRHKRLGELADRPTRIKYKPFKRG